MSRGLGDVYKRQGYEVVPGAEKYQFAKPGPDGTDVGGIKIDILTGPQSRFNGTTVKADRGFYWNLINFGDR